MTKTSKRYIIVFVEIIFLLLLTLAIFFFDLDIKLQKFSYQPNSSSSVWYQKENPFWQFGYHYGPLPAFLLTFAALVGFILSWIKPKIKNYRRYFLLIILTLIISPGLLVNTIFKDYWGRPRPRQVQEFGGRWEFKQVWQPGTPGKGKSFPCGHCSMGFFFIVLYYSFKQKHKILACASLVFSLTFGTFIGFARISQGGHFLSDVLWSCGLTYITTTILYYFILKIPDKYEKAQQMPTVKIHQKISKIKLIFVIIAMVLATAIMIFIFLFSKPFYKEYFHNINSDDRFKIIQLDFQLERGHISIFSGKYDHPIHIQTIIQGYGFPKYIFNSKLLNEIKDDTLRATYLLNFKGVFDEIDVATSVYIDSSQVVHLSGTTQDGSIFFVENSSTKLKTSFETLDEQHN